MKTISLLLVQIASTAMKCLSALNAIGTQLSDLALHQLAIVKQQDSIIAAIGEMELQLVQIQNLLGNPGDGDQEQQALDSEVANLKATNDALESDVTAQK